MEEETITISKKEYDDLIRDSNILEALYIAGVDNWELYDSALETVNDD